jgi:hypothetical protein
VQSASDEASIRSQCAESLHHLLRALTQASPAHVLSAREAADSVRSVCRSPQQSLPPGLPSVSLRADAWLVLLKVDPRPTALDDLHAAARLSVPVLRAAFAEVPGSAAFDALLEPLACLPAPPASLADEDARLRLRNLVYLYMNEVAPRMVIDGATPLQVDAHDACCRYQAALLRLALQYIDPALVGHVCRVRVATLDEFACECLASALAPLADLARRQLVVDAVLVCDDSTLPFFLLVALFLTRREAILATAATAMTRDSLVAALSVRDDAAMFGALQSLPSVAARLPASMKQQVQSTFHAEGGRQWKRWRSYALSAPCLRISLAELVLHRPPAPAHFGVDVRRVEALRGGRLVACAQQVAVADVLNKPTCSRLVQQLGAMRGSHIALVGTGDGGHDDAALAQLVRELIASGVCFVSTVIGGYRNAHDAFMQGKRELITAHRIEHCDECKAPPPSSMHWRALPSGVSDGPDGDVSDIELLAGTASEKLATITDVMKRATAAADEARRRAQVKAAAAARSASQKSAVLISKKSQELREKLDTALEKIDDIADRVDEMLPTRLQAIPSSTPAPVPAPTPAPAPVPAAPAVPIVTEEPVGDDSWLNFDLDDDRPSTPPQPPQADAAAPIDESVSESVAAPEPVQTAAPEPVQVAASEPVQTVASVVSVAALAVSPAPSHDVLLSQFGEDSIFYCTAADKSPRYLAVSDDQVLELVRQDRIGGFCNIVAKVDLLDIATMTFTLRDVTFERRTVGALPHKIFVTDLDVRDKIVARVTAAVKAARKRQRQASRSTSAAPKE